MKEPSKRPRGRPSKGGPEPMRYFRMADDDYDRLALAAAILEISASEFIRQTCLRRAERVIRNHDREQG